MTYETYLGDLNAAMNDRLRERMKERCKEIAVLKPFCEFFEVLEANRDIECAILVLDGSHAHYLITGPNLGGPLTLRPHGGTRSAGPRQLVLSQGPKELAFVTPLRGSDANDCPSLRTIATTIGSLKGDNSPLDDDPDD